MGVRNDRLCRCESSAGDGEGPASGHVWEGEGDGWMDGRKAVYVDED